MLDSSNNISYPFNIYDHKKHHGFIYSPIDKLYHQTDKYTVKKFVPRDTQIINEKEIDLRPLMDVVNDKIPIGENQILVPSTKEYRERNSQDYFTYSLEYPVYNNRVEIYLTKLISSDTERSFLKNYLLSSLISYSPSLYIIIHGERKSAELLFRLLSLLDPIIKYGRFSLYCEEIVNKIVLDEIHQAKIVLCDIMNRTLRIAHLSDNKNYNRPIQYHGIVYQKDLSCFAKDNIGQIVKLNSQVDEKGFSPGELLGWILS